MGEGRGFVRVLSGEAEEVAETTEGEVEGGGEGLAGSWFFEAGGPDVLFFGGGGGGGGVEEGAGIEGGKGGRGARCFFQPC